MASRIPALRRIANRWSVRGGTPKEEFLADAQAYHEDLPGFQGIAWVDKDFYVRWIYPLWGNEKALNLNLGFEEKRRTTLEQSRNGNKLLMTPPIDLIQGDKGLIVYFPIYIGSRFDGFISAVFNVDQWLGHVLQYHGVKAAMNEYTIIVEVDGETSFQQLGEEDLGQTEFDAVVTTTVLGHKFSLYCRPTGVFFKQHHATVPDIAAGVGFVLSLLVSFVVYLYQKVSRQASRARVSNIALANAAREQKATALELKRFSTRLSLAAKAGKIGIWEWEIASDNLVWDEQMFDLYGVPHTETSVFETWTKALHPEDAAQAINLIREAVDGNAVFDTEFRITLPDGTVRYILAMADVERDAQGKPIRMTGVNWDITERKHDQETILHMANHDALTDLPTLRLARDRVSVAFAVAQRKNLQSVVMFVDLDGFKDVNDTHGHDTGDAVLREVAKRLLACVRQIDTVARIGGDEFLVVLAELHAESEAAFIAEKIIKAISAPICFDGEKLTVGASIGIASCPSTCVEIDALIKRADDAMYQVKKSGKNGYAFADPHP
ncbi:MAG: diguanylate cyclase [Proteobacteria bacterium]|nr:diguanylate cyclase [Pseudomonadota bacterium]